MSEPLCAPLVACGEVDSPVLFRRSVYGPSLVSDDRPLSLGDLTLGSAAVRAYLDLTFEVRWVPKEVCLGPLASVMTLAPGETVTVATRSVHRTSFTDLMRDGADSSSVSTQTRQGSGAAVADLAAKLAEQQKVGGTQSGGDAAEGAATSDAASDGASAADSIELQPIYASGYGSFLTDFLDGVAAVATGGASIAVGAAADAVGDLVSNAVGQAGNLGAPVGSSLAGISEIIDTISRTESQSHLAETTHSTQDTTSTSITRTFSNPYRDRTMQLRFMPVFRRFDASVNVSSARAGLAMICGAPDVARARVPANASTYTKAFLRNAFDARDQSALQGAFAQLLARNSGDRAHGTPRLASGLAWSDYSVRSNVVHVPLGDLPSVRSAWRLDDAAHETLATALDQLTAPVLGQLAAKTATKAVHLYIGSHIEAVPGTCLLPGIVTDALNAPTSKPSSTPSSTPSP